MFLAVGRVGSSTDLIAQRVELVQEMDKRNHLFDLLRSQKSNGTCSKVQLMSFNSIGMLLCLYLQCSGFGCLEIGGKLEVRVGYII